MNKNEVGFWIDYKGFAKFAETSPEMEVKKVLESIQQKVGFTFKHGTQAYPLSVECVSDSGDGSFTLHPDFIVSMPRTHSFGQLEKVVEVDGKYHFTHWQEKKTKWRDSLLLKHGFDVIHVDARIAIYKRHHEYLKRNLRRALEHGSPVEVINY